MASKAADQWSKAAPDYRQTMQNSRTLSPGWQYFTNDIGSYLREQPTSARRVLDIGAGHGEPAFSLIRELTDVSITITDIAPEMVRLAEQDARQQGFTSVSFQATPGEDLGMFPDDSFDVVMCAFAVFMMDHKRALKEWLRVLKPGGYLAFNTWGPREKHQLVACWMGVVREITPDWRPPAPIHEDVSIPENVMKTLQETGFQDATYKPYNVPMHIKAEDLDSMFTNPTIGGNWLEANTQPGPDREAFKQRTIDALLKSASQKSYVQENGDLHFPVQGTWYFTAFKPQK